MIKVSAQIFSTASRRKPNKINIEFQIYMTIYIAF